MKTENKQWNDNNQIDGQLVQPYHLKMYHYQSLEMTGENDVQEDSLFNLHASYENQLKSERHKHNIRSKRTSENSRGSFKNNAYDDENLYKGSFEPSNDSIGNQSYDYNYEDFKDEYYQDGTSENTSSNATLYDDDQENQDITTDLNLNKTLLEDITANKNVPMENYCSVVLFFRTRVLQCFLFGISQGNDDITRRSSWVIAFWITIYIVTAVYLWCTKGWCCCCCPCSCCHPRSVLHEAKEFLSQNPPGVAQLHSKRKIFYDPSDYERHCYTALEKEVFNF